MRSSYLSGAESDFLAYVYFIRNPLDMPRNSNATSKKSNPVLVIKAEDLPITNPPIPKKKKVKNFVNNADMLKEINLSKTKMRANPKLLPSECITRTLAMMFLQMVDRYGNRRNWSQYTYLDEFKGAAIGNLCAKWHCFDETKYDNPFAYYTQLIERSFKGQIVKEKKISLVRDALLIDMGKTPSYDAQIRHEQKVVAAKGANE